jgi:hypothetical protein
MFSSGLLCSVHESVALPRLLDSLVYFFLLVWVQELYVLALFSVMLAGMESVLEEPIPRMFFLLQVIFVSLSALLPILRALTEP